MQGEGLHDFGELCFWNEPHIDRGDEVSLWTGLDGNQYRQDGDHTELDRATDTRSGHTPDRYWYFHAHFTTVNTHKAS